MYKYVIKNLHKKLLNAGVLITPSIYNKFETNQIYNDFNYKDISFVNFTKYSLQFYEILQFLKLVKKLSLKVIYIYGTETPMTQKLQLLAQTTNANYFIGKWVNGFFTNKLFLTTTALFTKNDEKKIFCPQKPHVAIVFWSKNCSKILAELHKAGIITILIGGRGEDTCRPSYYLPGSDLNLRNYLFYFTFFLTFFNPVLYSKINCFNYNKLFSS